MNSLKNENLSTTQANTYIFPHFMKKANKLESFSQKHIKNLSILFL